MAVACPLAIYSTLNHHQLLLATVHWVPSFCLSGWFLVVPALEFETCYNVFLQVNNNRQGKSGSLSAIYASATVLGPIVSSFFWALNLWRNLLLQGWLSLSFVLAGENWDSNILLRASYAGNEVVAVGRGPAVSRCGLGELRRLWVQPWGRRNSSHVVKQLPCELVCAEEGGKKWMQSWRIESPLVLQCWAVPLYWGRNCGKQLMMSWEKRGPRTWEPLLFL